MQALVDIVRQGKALYVGVSNWPLEPLRQANEYLRAHNVPLLIYQGRLNLLDRKPIDEGILDYCAEQGIGFISFSPLAQGLLTDRYLNGIPADSRMALGKFLRHEQLTPQLLGLPQKAQRHGRLTTRDTRRDGLGMGAPPARHDSVLVGASSVAQLEKNMRCIDAQPFSDAEI
jgi:L-glyceraldehyde 3-phosphate reductase